MKGDKNINNFLIKNKFKKAFTLSEVVIATFISSIVLSFIFIFLSDMVEGINETKEEVRVVSSFYDFTNKLNNYRNVYITWSILIETSSWSDIFLMEDYSWENGILIWPVKLFDNQLTSENTVYEEKAIWFRKISSTELAEIDLNRDIIYDYSFQDDQIFSDLKIQDIIILSYNSWSLFDFRLVVDTNFQIALLWQLRADLPRDSLKKFNINF